MPRARLITAVTISAAVFTAAILATPASATITRSGSFTASCDPTHYGANSDGVYYNHAVDGTVKVKQVSTSPSLHSNIDMASKTSGKRLGYKAAWDGDTVSWSGTLAGYYKVAAIAESDKNCNGISPGNGNYKFNYEVTL